MFTKWSNFAVRAHTSLDRRRLFFGGYEEGFRLALRDVGFGCRPRRDPKTWAAKCCDHKTPCSAWTRILFKLFASFDVNTEGCKLKKSKGFGW